MKSGKTLKTLAAIAGFLVLAISSQAQTTRSRGALNVLDFGAAGNGTTDDTAAIQSTLNAAAAQQNSTYFPCGIYGVSKPLEVSSAVRLEACATILALAPMNAVVQIGSAGYVKDGWFRGGVIDANGLANDGLFLRQFQHINVVDTEVRNAQVNGFHLGDPSLNGGYEGILTNVRTRRTIGTVPPSSTSLLIDSNAGDNNITNAVFSGSDAGVRTMTGGNFFTDIHVVSAPGAGWMTVGFDDYGSGNFWRGCEADTIAQAGMHAHKYNTIIEGCRFFNNSSYGRDNTAVGILFDQASPYATLSGDVFMGQDSSHRLAQDVQGSSAANVKLFGNQYANVSQHY